MITLKDYEKFEDYRLLILDTDKVFARELRSHLHMFNIESDIKSIPASKNFVKVTSDYNLIITDLDELLHRNDYKMITHYLNCFKNIIFTTSHNDIGESTIHYQFNQLIKKNNYTLLIEKILLYLKKIQINYN